jgi:hypothetical protein
MDVTKLINFRNYNFNFRQPANQNSAVCYQDFTSYFSSFFIFICLYQKDEKAMPGNILTIRCSFSSPEVVSLTSPYFLFVYTLLSFISLSISLPAPWATFLFSLLDPFGFRNRLKNLNRFYLWNLYRPPAVHLTVSPRNKPSCRFANKRHHKLSFNCLIQMSPVSCVNFRVSNDM